MSDPISDVEKAEQLSRRRARMMMPFAVIFVTLQATFFSAGANDHRLVSWVHTLGWLMLAAVILAALVTGGFWFRPKAVRALMEDEVTRENRHRALSLGFVMAMGAAMVLFVVDRIEPIGAQAAIHIILSAGLGTGLVVFAALERRALG
jgi:hypothetical protein